MNKKIDLIILGGSGLVGSAIILKFLSKGKIVLNLDIINKINKKNNYIFKKFDMTSHGLSKNLNKIFKEFGCPNFYIDCSYINKKYFKNSDIESINKNHLDNILKNWLSSSTIISSRILNLMKRNKIKGKVVLTSSIYGLVAQDKNVYKNTKIKNNLIYSIVKSAVNNLVKNAAVRFGEYGIRVNSISPGGVYNNKDKNFKDKNFIKNYLSRVPLNTFANADDIANTYWFLCSNESSYITGVNLVVDGGYTLV